MLNAVMGHRIAVIAGDGTGPEVIREGIKALDAISDTYNVVFEFHTQDIGSERYLRTGHILDEADIHHLKTYDAIYLGAIGHPDVPPGILERGILLKLRFELDQYINLRPVKLYENVDTPFRQMRPKDIDYVIVRENTGGLYTGVGRWEHKGTEQEIAVQEMVYSRSQVERCMRFAFKTARSRRRKLTVCGKSNVLMYVSDLWQRVCDDLSPEYPDVQVDYVHVDAACVYMLENPARFDVIVTSNMFGDIITDLAAVTQGGMGVAAGGNINPDGVSMFEPIGGTAPDFTGKNQINPIAAIGAAHLMLDNLGETEAAACLEQAKLSAVARMASMQAGKMGYGTDEIGDMVANEVKKRRILA